jgi:hypothetical protein
MSDFICGPASSPVNAPSSFPEFRSRAPTQLVPNQLGLDMVGDILTTRSLQNIWDIQIFKYRYRPLYIMLGECLTLCSWFSPCGILTYCTVQYVSQALRTVLYFSSVYMSSYIEHKWNLAYVRQLQEMPVLVCTIPFLDSAKLYGGGNFS